MQVTQILATIALNSQGSGITDAMLELAKEIYNAGIKAERELYPAVTTIGEIPYDDRVFVEVGLSELELRATKGGILLPDSSKENQDITDGTIVAIGTRCNNPFIPVSLGMKVRFSKFSGSDFERDGRKFKALRLVDLWSAYTENVPTSPAIEDRMATVSEPIESTTK